MISSSIISKQFECHPELIPVCRQAGKDEYQNTKIILLINTKFNTLRQACLELVERLSVTKKVKYDVMLSCTSSAVEMKSKHE